MFSVLRKSPAKTLFPPLGNCFVSATVLTIFPYLFSSRGFESRYKSYSQSGLGAEKLLPEYDLELADKE